MPRIFDNIDRTLLPALRETLTAGEHADFCVGYFNLRGWRHLADRIEPWRGGEGHCCRLLVGMQAAPSEELRRALAIAGHPDRLDNQTALRERRRLAEDFRRQLTLGVPTDADESALRQLAAQLHAGKLIVKVYLPHPLHAKLYLVHRQDADNPMTAFVGSSNLTMAGLAAQGELNVDVLEHDACAKLAAWFEDRWRERWCIDISKELAAIIDLSWAADRLVPPYHVYLKMAWHLSQEARTGLLEYRIPAVFGQTLFDFQVAAVKIAAHHLNRRGGVLSGEPEFIRRHQCAVRSLAAFDKSEEPDDWRDLMRLYMVRRTRGFIMQNYAQEDERGRYLRFPDGTRSYFPRRAPKNLTFPIRDADPTDAYARFYSAPVLDTINALVLPRYGLGNYLAPAPDHPPTPAQDRLIADLSRAGSRLKGFCRTNLFKRLESAGPAFLLSVQRHILRNFIVLHAIEQGLDIPLGTQSADLLDTRADDEDAEATLPPADDEGDTETGSGNEDTADPATGPGQGVHRGPRTEAGFRARAEALYRAYAGPLKRRFKWLPARLFIPALAEDLQADARALMAVLDTCGDWDPARDAKLTELYRLIAERHPREKLLVFTQFADTARYLAETLKARGIAAVAEATGRSADPTALAWRFAPDANDQRGQLGPGEELRVLIATDVLSEGQNLQDCAVVVNYDLPWAIIRLIQRAGRVDRIGQRAKRILCYSFVPADGVERLIRLRQRVRQRLIQNAEVVGSDERFFDDDANDQAVRDLYTEQSGILDDDADTEVDLASYAYQIWKNATDADPRLAARIEALPDVVYATKAQPPAGGSPPGVLVYTRTAQGNDALAWIDAAGRPVTQSQLTILKAAACTADTPALPRRDDHHDLTEQGLAHIVAEEKSSGGALGRPSGARYRTYDRLKRHRAALGDKRDLFVTDEHVRQVDRALEEIYRYPLCQSATDTLNRQIKSGIDDHQLADLVLRLREDGRLCVLSDEDEAREPRLICTMGLTAPAPD